MNHIKLKDLISRASTLTANSGDIRNLRLLASEVLGPDSDVKKELDKLWLSHKGGG